MMMAEGNKLLEDKVVLVTGAAGGIGRAIALSAAAAGASVVVNDVGVSLGGERENVGAAQVVVDEIRANGGKALANTDDVSAADGGRNMVAAAVAEFGRLDAVVNNAGILRDGFFHKMDIADFDAVLKVHLYGAFNVSRAAADIFRSQQGGSLIHMTSTSGLVGNFAQANYASAKLGIVALSKSIALDLGRWGVRSNCIAPFAWSRMTSAIKAESAEQQARVAKLQEMKPETVAPVAIYLASDLSNDVTGQIFTVRNNELFVMSQPRPVRSIHRDTGWTPQSIAEHAIPALRPAFHALDVSADVFSWDPV